jgi:hypothetical protein
MTYVYEFVYMVVRGPHKGQKQTVTITSENEEGDFSKPAAEVLEQCVFRLAPVEDMEFVGGMSYLKEDT